MRYVVIYGGTNFDPLIGANEKKWTDIEADDHEGAVIEANERMNQTPGDAAYREDEFELYLLIDENNDSFMVYVDGYGNIQEVM